MEELEDRVEALEPTAEDPTLSVEERLGDLIKKLAAPREMAGLERLGEIVHEMAAETSGADSNLRARVLAFLREIRLGNSTSQNELMRRLAQLALTMKRDSSSSSK